MLRAFTLIELMIVAAIIAIIAAIIAIIAAILIPNSTKKANGPALEMPSVESVLSVADMPTVDHARVIVLPTGERILFVSGNYRASVCLLPPLPAKNVEK